MFLVPFFRNGISGISIRSEKYQLMKSEERCSFALIVPPIFTLKMKDKHTYMNPDVTELVDRIFQTYRWISEVSHRVQRLVATQLCENRKLLANSGSN